MDATQQLVDATRRYLDGALTLPELADVEASLVHLWPRLAHDGLVSRLMGTIEQGLAFMDDGVGTEGDLQAALKRELATTMVQTVQAPVDRDAQRQAAIERLRSIHERMAGVTEEEVLAALTGSNAIRTAFSGS